MEQRLEVAAREGNVDALYSLVKEDAYVLERIEGVPFIDTPLHVAASAGQVHFAKEIMRWKRSFAKKPNQEGLCPIHLAAKNGHIETLKQILSFDRGLARLQGREGKTSLHYAAEKGDTKLPGILLSACPPSMGVVTDRSDTALHIAIKHSKFDALSFLLRRLQTAIHEGSIEQETKILNFQDENGNTVLHIAVEMNLHEVVELLIDSGVKVNVKNSADQTALDIAKGQGQAQDKTTIKEMLARGSGSTSSLFRCTAAFADHCKNKGPRTLVKAVTYMIRYKRAISMKSRDLLLGVSVLIATITYQTAVDPPKNPRRDDNNNDRNLISCLLDTPINNFSSPNCTLICSMHNSNATSHRHGLSAANSRNEALFWASNILALFSSILTILLLLPGTYIRFIMSMPLYFFVYCYMVTTGITGSFTCSVVTCALFLMSIIMLVYIDAISRWLNEGPNYTSVPATARQ